MWHRLFFVLGKTAGLRAASTVLRLCQGHGQAKSARRPHGRDSSGSLQPLPNLAESIVSRSPGQLVLRIPPFPRSRLSPRQLESRLSRQEGIRTVQIRGPIAKITYDSSRADESDIISHITTFSAGKRRSTVLSPRALAKAGLHHLEDHPRSHLLLSLLTLGSTLSGKVPPAAINVPLCITSLPTYRRALRALVKERTLSVDFLDALAHTIAQSKGDYTAVAFMSLILSLGDFLRYKTATTVTRSITNLLAFDQDDAWLERDGRTIRVPVTDIGVGDTVIVNPGQVVPVDGTVIHGASSVDQRSLTGESLPVVKAQADRVHAGTIALDGVLKLTADRVGRDTSVARIITVVTEGAKSTTAIEDYARKFGDKLVIPTLAISAATSLATRDLNRFGTMIIVDFGTGMRVSAPTVFLSHMIAAARLGVLIKGGSSIEKLNHADVVVFDKTGTLTVGEPSVRNVIALDNRFSKRDILRLAAAAEGQFSHPVAVAIRKSAQERLLDIPDPSEVTYHIGYGIECHIGDKHVVVGCERLCAMRRIETSPAYKEIRSLHEAGDSVMCLAVDGRLAGLVSYADTIRKEAREVITALRSRGVKRVVMLTGDDNRIAAAIARQVGCDEYVAEALPEEKLECVRRLQRGGHTVVAIGDGINDSPALTAADVGITVKGGVELTRQSADVILMHDNLWTVVAAFDVSHKAMRLIKQNRRLLYAINCGVVLAAGLGIVSPVVTSAISDGASILATVNALRPLIRNRTASGRVDGGGGVVTAAG